MGSIPEIKTILYTTDLGEHTRPVFRQALNMARHHNAKIVMLHVVEPLGATGQAVLDAFLPRKTIDKVEQKGMKKVLKLMKERLAGFCEEELGDCPSKSPLVKELVVAHGHPDEHILKEADAHDVDLIVMGSCTHRFLGAGQLGSSTRYVLAHAKRPVLVVPFS